MMDRELAVTIQNHCLAAIAELSRLLYSAQGKCSDKEFEKIKRAVGLIIGQYLEGEILQTIYSQHPDLDNLE